eukprot:scaffold24256_cov50-Phaeocystis_antarctica.AAC.1
MGEAGNWAYGRARTISDDLKADNTSSRELQDPGSAVQNAVRCARSRSRVPGSSVARESRVAWTGSHGHHPGS